MEEKREDRTLSSALALPRIRRASPLTSFFQTLAAGEAVDTRVIEPGLLVLQESSNKRWAEKIVAAHLLGRVALPSYQRKQVIKGLIRALQDAALSQDSDRRLGSWFLRATYIAVPMTVLMRLYVVQRPQNWSGLTVFALLFMGYMLALFPALFLSYGMETWRLTRVRASCSAALGRLRGVEGINELAHHAVHDNSFTVRHACRYTLESVLPLLTEQEYGTLNVLTIPNLCSLLTPSFPERSRIVLEALEKVGGGSAVEPVELYIASRLNVWRVQASSYVDPNTELAERILPILKDRQRKEKEAGSLLRAAAAPGGPDETLLRPASNVEGGDQNVLLRPMEGE